MEKANISTTVKAIAINNEIRKNDFHGLFRILNNKSALFPLYIFIFSCKLDDWRNSFAFLVASRASS